MKNIYIAFLTLTLCLTSWASFAQESFAVPRLATGQPDFNGIYEWPMQLPGDATCRCSATVFDPKYFSPLLEGGEAFIKPRTGDMFLDEPRSFCMPAGFPAGMLSANAMQWSQTDDYLIMAHEFQSMTRIIPLDGRPHRERIEPSFYGDPVGHWEEDTLVIETTNFRRWALDDHYYTNPDEYRMHSDELTTIEHIRWIDSETLSYVLTIDDPKIFTEPWSQEFTISSKPDWHELGILEMVCQENNRCPGGNCVTE